MFDSPSVNHYSASPHQAPDPDERAVPAKEETGNAEEEEDPISLPGPDTKDSADEDPISLPGPDTKD
jgi:hypothetical protein